MIWIAVGIISVFWDGPMGIYFPLLPSFVYGVFWKKAHPIVIMIILYLHFVLGGGNGSFEMITMFIMLVTTLVEDIFYSRSALYILYSTIFLVIIFIYFGIISTITSAIQILVVYSLRKL